MIYGSSYNGLIDILFESPFLNIKDFIKSTSWFDETRDDILIQIYSSISNLAGWDSLRDIFSNKSTEQLRSLTFSSVLFETFFIAFSCKN
jgi:hypothetical protein